jgi:prefoldin subunit 5
MIERRLQELRKEFKMGEAQLEDLDRRRAQLRDTLLRISGAIQVLEEMLNSEPEGNQESVNLEEPEMEAAATR